jgi:peptidyl-prolyl cis-trans isomerase D
MSIIQQIRERYAAVSIAVIALSLIGFILMDALSSRSNLFSGNSTTVGEVNGKEIDYAAFSTRVEEMENNYRSQGMEVNEEMRQQIIEALWSNEVEETLLKNEYEKLGVTFSGTDMNEALYGDNPPPVLTQQFKTPEGAYDVNAARQFINSLKKKKPNDPQRQYVEKNLLTYLVSTGLRNKYNSLLSGSIYYPKWLSDKDVNDQNSIASISFVTVPYTTIPDSTITVTDGDIESYLQKHKLEYKQEKSRTISYIVFDAAPTSSDTAIARESVAKMKTQFTQAADAAQFVNANGSAVTYFDGYVLKSKMQVPNADSIQSLAEGNVFGPYLDGSNYVLARMISKRSMPDSVKCRHILIGTKDPQSGAEIMSDSVAHAKADSIAAVVAKGGNFAALATQFSTDEGSKANGGEYDFSSQQFGSLAREFAEFIFYNPAGSKKVVKTQFGWHYIEVMNQKNFEPSYKIAYYAKPVEASDETVNTASLAATMFASESRDLKSFDANAQKKKLATRVAEVKPTDYSIVGIGGARRLIKWAYENKIGTVSEPESIADKYVVAIITNEKKEGVPGAKDARLQVESIVRNNKKAQIIIKNIGNKRDLNAIAVEYKTVVNRADSITFLSPFIPGIGQESKVSGAAFDARNKGKVSEPIAGNAGVFLVKNESIGLKPSTEGDYAMRRMQMEQSLKGNIGYKYTESLRKSAKVKDNRITFY